MTTATAALPSIPSDTVSVYTSPTKVAICEGDEKVGAAPAVPDLSMSVAEIFAKL
jgi:hypothetical protein